MPSVKLVPANLAAVFLESLLYGIFVILAAASIYLRSKRFNNGRRSAAFQEPRLSGNPKLLATVALLMTVTAHWVLTVTQLFGAFVHYKGGQAPSEFYGALHQPTDAVKSGFLVASLFIGDAMITYRLWIIWGRKNLAIVFPVVSLLAFLACGIGLTYQSTRHYPGEDVFVSSTDGWTIGFCIFTLCTHAYSSSLIALRIWRQNENAKQLSSGSLMGEFAVYVESATLYIIWVIFFFVSCLVRSNLRFTVIGTLAAMAGIACEFTSVRLMAQYTPEDGIPWQTHDVPAERPGAPFARNPRVGSVILLRPLTIDVTHVVKPEEL